MPPRSIRLFALCSLIAACSSDGDTTDITPIVNEACDITEGSALCRTHTIAMVGVSTDLRRVYWNAPSGDAPAGGRPAVVLYQRLVHHALGRLSLSQ